MPLFEVETKFAHYHHLGRRRADRHRRVEQSISEEPRGFPTHASGRRDKWSLRWKSAIGISGPA